VKEPEVLGVPDMSPVGLMLSPGGREPETMLKAMGPCPPEVRICLLYVLPINA
jgi:hypothetical protein